MSTKRECRPTLYAVVSNKGSISYGFRCAFCGVHTKRYSTEELRDERLREHQAVAKKRAKKS